MQGELQGLGGAGLEGLGAALPPSLLLHVFPEINPIAEDAWPDQGRGVRWRFCASKEGRVLNRNLASVCSLVFEAESEEEDVMRRPPRPPSESTAPAWLIAWNLFQGLFAFSIVAGVLFVGLRRSMPVDEVRALTFFALVLTSVGLILVNRAISASVVTALRRPNPALAWILATVAAILGLALLWPFATDLFRFGPLHLDDLALTVAAELSCSHVSMSSSLFEAPWGEADAAIARHRPSHGKCFRGNAVRTSLEPQGDRHPALSVALRRALHNCANRSNVGSLLSGLE